MPQRVVDRLEMVDIKQDGCQRPVSLWLSQQFKPKPGDGLTVVDAGQIVERGLFLEFGNQDVPLTLKFVAMFQLVTQDSHGTVHVAHFILTVRRGEVRVQSSSGQCHQSPRRSQQWRDDPSLELVQDDQHAGQNQREGC